LSVTLRDYQVQALESIWDSISESNEALCVLPTGSGKTVIMSELINRSLEHNVNILVLINRVQLIEQTAQKLKEYGLKCGVYCASLNDKDMSSGVTVASVHSIFNTDIAKIDMLICDETHQAMNEDEDSRYYIFIKKLRDINPKIKIVGFTATPFRASTGPIYGPDKIFKSISFSLPIEHMIAEGHLVRPISKKPTHQIDLTKLRTRLGEYMQEDVDKLVMDLETMEAHVADAIKRLEGRRKVMWACASIEHAEAIAERILQISGEACSVVHSKLSSETASLERSSFEDLKGRRHIAFVTMMTEGYDYPPGDALVLLRPIRSPVLYIQICGRVLRPYEGKTDALILDYGRVVETLGPISDPYIPETGKRKKYLETLMGFCKACLSYIDIKATICPDCGHEKEIERRSSKVSSRAFEGSLLKKEPIEKTMGVRSVFLSRFLSKNGNECLKITYLPTSLSDKPIYEFFATTNEYVIRKRLVPRLNDLGISYGSIPHMMRANAKTPSSINYLMTKYPEVIRLVFDDRERDRDGNT
jgi:DNA repair protein RadD